jgi:Caspase domain
MLINSRLLENYQLEVNMPVLQHLQMRIKRFVGLALVTCLFLTYSSIAQAPLDVRVALVIGNAAYVHIPALGNSSNDARSMATVLRKLGFQVVEVVDGSKAQMDKAVENLQDLLKGKQAVAMLYYAGHGLQLDWHNYMVPVDVKLTQAADVPKQTIDIETVISSFKKATTRMNIIVLDACRDNPFAGKVSGKGLAQLDAPVGTFLAFATAPGNVAEDGDVDSGNGLFTQYLLKELQKPARIEDVFKRVRLQVRQKSQGRQIPWDSSSLEDDFSFNDGNKHTFNPEDLIKEAKAREDKLRAQLEAAKQEEQRIAKEQELEKQRLAEIQKVQELKAREKAIAEARERERQLALAAEQEKQKALSAQQAIAKAKEEEAQRLKDIEFAKLQAAEEAKRNKANSEEARGKQFAVEKADWEKIKDSQNSVEIYAFLNKYPSGLMSELANAKLEILDKAKIKPQADQFGRIQELAPRRYAEGDIYEFVGKDGYTGLVKWNQTFTVLKVDDEGADVQGIRSGAPNFKFRVAHAGAQHSNESGKFDPPVTLMPAGVFQVGRKWFARTNFTSVRNNTQEWLEVSGHVVSREMIQVPFGKFDTFKVEIQMQYQSGNRLKLTIWTDPSIGVGIKNISEFRSVRGGAADVTVRELVSIKRSS